MWLFDFVGILYYYLKVSIKLGEDITESDVVVVLLVEIFLGKFVYRKIFENYIY